MHVSKAPQSAILRQSCAADRMADEFVQFCEFELVVQLCLQLPAFTPASPTHITILSQAWLQRSAPDPLLLLLSLPQL